MHELIIGILIIAIVAIQAYVFTITRKKIKIFKNILPSQENFKIVKVLIKESEIETISLVDIFINLQKNIINAEKKTENNEIADTKNHQKNGQMRVTFDEVIDNETSEILFEVKVDKRSVIINEEVNIKFNINKNGDNFTPKPFDGFNLVKGPISEVSQSSLEGGGSYLKSYCYTLRPIRTGNLIIQKASIEFNGEIYESNRIIINVKEY